MTTDWKRYWKERGGLRHSPHRPHAKWCNYRQRGIYLITIVTHKHKRVLGELSSQSSQPTIELTNIGQFIEREWQSLPTKQAEHGRYVTILAHQVMPDHFHGILQVDKEMDVSVGAVIRDFKAQCTKQWRKMHQPNLADQPPHQPRMADSIESAETKARLARMSRKQREAYYEQQGIEPLFEDNYDDTVCFREGQVENAIRYVHDNPRRLALKRANPQLFKLHQHRKVAGFTCTTLGNQFLLDFPMKGVIQCSRRLTQTEIDDKKEEFRISNRKACILKLAPQGNFCSLSQMRKCLRTGK